MSSPDCKRRKLAGDVNSVAEMSNVSPKKDCGSSSDDVTNTASASNKRSIIKKNVYTFEEVASLDGFVDRTMLIKELLDDTKEKEVMIFAPSKFGKTINLDMIRFFCEIEDKYTKTKENIAKKPTMDELRDNPSQKMKVLLRQFDNKQYKDEECLILKEEDIVKEHFGRHPVILFDFKECKPKNESDALYECAERVKDSYVENGYLIDSKELCGSLENTRLKETCTDWCSYKNADLENLINAQVIRGLKDLVKSLRIHWGRKPVFLVDEIDKPCVAALGALRNKLDESEIQKIGSVVSSVVCSIFKQQDAKLKLEAVLFTGISRFNNAGLSDMDSAVETFYLGDDRFSKYYGLTTEQVESLVRKFFVSEKDAEIKTIIDKIKENYNGYYQRPSSDAKEESKECARYCLFSVLSYLQKRYESKNVPKLNFWTERDGLISQLVSVLKRSDIIMRYVQTLVYEQSGIIPITYQEKVDAEHLLGIYRNDITPNPDAIFNFFLQRGLLAHNPEKPEEEVAEGQKIYVRIPNLEIKRLYHAMFKTYYNQTQPKVNVAFTSCGEFFESLPTVLEPSMFNLIKFQEDLNKLCVNLKCIFGHTNCESERSVCGFMMTILKINAGYDRAEQEYKTQYLDKNNEQKNVFIDVWGKHGNFALILEVKHHRSANGEPGRIGSKKESSLAAAEDIVKFLPGNEPPDCDKSIGKAGTGRNLEVLNSTDIKKYLLVGLAVDGDGTTHMLVFPNSDKWEDVIAVNPEKHVAELISAYKKSKELILSDNRIDENVVI